MADISKEPKRNLIEPFISSAKYDALFLSIAHVWRQKFLLA